MSFYAITDQGMVERFVTGEGEEIMRLPAFGSWRRWSDPTGLWHDQREARLRASYARCVRAHADAAQWGKELQERQFWLHSLSWQGQNSALSLLREWPELDAEPGQFDRYQRGLAVPGGWVLADHLLEKQYTRGMLPVPKERLFAGEMFHRCMGTSDPWAFTTGPVYDLCCSELTQDPQGMMDFLCAALAHDRFTQPRLMLRTDFFDGCLDPLFPALLPFWGSYVEILPPSVWLNPHRLSYAWARRIQGCRLLFLEGAKGNWGAQHDALQVWLRFESLTYLGADDVRHRLELPSHYVLCGTGTKPGMVDPGITDLLWFVPAISVRNRRGLR